MLKRSLEFVLFIALGVFIGCTTSKPAAMRSTERLARKSGLARPLISTCVPLEYVLRCTVFDGAESVTVEFVR